MTQISKEYAEALFELALQENSLDETAAALDLVKEVLQQTPGYRDLLASPAIGKEVRFHALEECFRGKVPEIVLGILRMMVSRGQVSSLDDMMVSFEELLLHHRGEAIAHVSSAVALSEKEAVALKAKLEARFNRKVSLKCQVDESLLGGIRVEMDGQVIDGSLKNKLQQIKDVMYS